MARKMSRKHHNEGTSASRELNNSLPRNVSYYQYLPSRKDTIYNSILVIVRDLLIDFMINGHIHGLEKHQFRSDSRHCWLTR